MTQHVVNVVMSGVFHAAILFLGAAGLQVVFGVQKIFMAESNIHHVPDFVARLYVIERGEIIYAGKPEDVHGDRAVMRVIGGVP